MGSDVSHFNVSLIVRDEVRRQYPQATTFEERREPKRNRTEVPAQLALRQADAIQLVIHSEERQELLLLTESVGIESTERYKSALEDPATWDSAVDERIH